MSSHPHESAVRKLLHSFGKRELDGKVALFVAGWLSLCLDQTL
jgi:hypothetical protein